MRRVKLISGKEGWFHGFSQNYEELRDGVGNFPAAIVEMDDGTIEIEYAVDVTFLDKPEVKVELNQG